MLTTGDGSGTLGGFKIQGKKVLPKMFWLQLAGVAALVTVGIFGIAFLEEKLVSGPRRRQLQEKARQKIQAGARREE